jgi:hypothetical protein
MISMERCPLNQISSLIISPFFVPTLTDVVDEEDSSSSSLFFEGTMGMCERKRCRDGNR